MKLFYETPDGRAKLYLGDARRLTAIEDESVDLVVTSPPYNVGKDYGPLIDDRKPLEEYDLLIRKALAEQYRVLRTGGRAVVEIGGAGRNFPLSWIVQDSAFDAGFLLRGELVIPHRATNRTAWGSYLSASDPFTIPNFHMVYMFSKGDHCRRDLRGIQIAIEPSQWYEWTLGRWHVPYGHCKGHSATFSDEFASRCILLLSGADDMIVDSFVGSGTTCAVAYKLGRKTIGVDLKEEYLEMAKKRLLQGVLL